MNEDITKDLSSILEQSIGLIDILIEKEKEKLKKLKDELPELVEIAKKMQGYNKNDKQI